MRPEVGEHEQQQPVHEFRGNPHLGVTFEVVGIGMRAEGDEPQRRLISFFPVMALFAGLETIIGVHGRFRIIRLQDDMTAVAVETLGRVRIAQLGDLAVIGVAVAREVLLMAASSILHDQEHGGVG